jgi:putative NADH-flavin reductase
MKLALLGTTGPSGKALVKEALDRGHELTIYTRSPSKVDAEVANNPRVTVIRGSITDLESLRECFRGRDAVLSILSPHFNQKTMAISEGLPVIFEAMKCEGVTRFIGTGTPSYVDPQDGSDIIIWILVTLVKLIFPKAYRDVVKFTNLVVEERDIEWSWFRIALANSKPKTGKVRYGYPGNANFTFGAIRREDLADVMLDELTDRKYVHQMPMIRTA